MQYVSNTTEDQKEMLKAIGASSIEELLKDIPTSLRVKKLDLPEGISEMELLSELTRRGQQNQHANRLPCFLGAGVYDHYVPPLVNQLVTRSEFITAYTPYQGEASQGTLQTIYEYQSMICLLTGMDVANASMYDGASAAAEAVLMALRTQDKTRVILLGPFHPEYAQTIHTHVSNINAEIVEIAEKDGSYDDKAFQAALNDNTACVMYQNPNFFGYLEDQERIVATSKAKGALVIAVVNPMALSLIEAPGNFGVDIAVGEGQPLGNSMAYGGPHFGFFAVKTEHMRRIPGRIAGMTQDKNGLRAFVLTLQAREQHIRREKATSNICTNHALCALKGLVFLSVLGPHGFRRMGELNVRQSQKNFKALTAIKGVKAHTNKPFFNEFVIHTDKKHDALSRSFETNKLIGPLHLKRFNSAWENSYLVATTEQRSDADIEKLAKAFKEA